MASQSRKLYVYAHTHWDREWYQPFETFRAQLLGLVRFLLPRLKAGTMPRFYLDGQAVIMEDVLAIEPEHADTFRSLMAEGKLSAGPWYILPDEMLVSGESLIRNLSLGIALTKRFGEPAMIGYCPDTFGHSQDLPNILSGFGISNAVVWRGVPLLEMGPVFWWNSPNGSRVMAYHLTRGYYQTGFHELAPLRNDAKCVSTFASRLQDWVGLVSGTNGGASPYYKLIDGALLPAGADHVAPPADLQALIEDVNAAAKKSKIDLQLVPTTLGDFLKMVEQRIASDKGLKILRSVDGELRFNRAAPVYERAYLLPGVLSTRLYLKRANRLSEYRLARLAEPLRAMMDIMRGGGSALGELEYAWKLLLKNQPHDSICGCSVDAVHDEMETRTAKLNDLLDSVLEKIAVDGSNKPVSDPRSHLDPDLHSDRLTVFNITSSSVSAPVHLRWMQAAGSKAPSAAMGRVQIDKKQKVDQLFAGWGSVPYYKEVDVYEGWVWTHDVPMLGFRSFPWGSEPNSSVVDTDVTVASNKISNGHLTINVSASGRMTVTQMLAGRPSKTYRLGHAIRDVGDGGDTYNFDPIPDDKEIEAKVTGVKVGKRGPLVGSLLLTYEIELPATVTEDGNLIKKSDPEASKIKLLKRSKAKIKHEITVEVSLKRGVPIVHFDAEWENKSTDHRLEVVFDTGSEVKSTYSENHLSVVRRYHNLRGLKEALPVAVAHEAHPDRYPAQRFVVGNGQVLFNTGMPEYAVEGSEISMTVLRAVSYLSKPRLWTRGGGAGPNMPVPGSNSLGINRCSYGWAPLSVPFTEMSGSGGDEWMPEAYRLTELYEGALWASIGTGRFSDGEGVDSRSIINIDNPNIRAIALYPEGTRSTVVRLLNVSSSSRVATVRFNYDVAKLESMNYGGEDVATLDLAALDKGWKTELEFGPYEIKTLRVTAK